MIPILVSLGLAAAAPASTDPAVATASQHVDPAAKTAALALARSFYSEDAQLAAAEKMIDSDIAPAFRANEDFKTLEAEYPGFTDAVLAQLRPALIRFTKQALPGYYDHVATLFASRLSAAEIVDLQHFYMTPTGQKMLHGMESNATVKSIIGEALSDPDKPTSTAAIAADHKAASEATKKLIDKSDEATLIEFSRKPYLKRPSALGPEMRKLEQDFMNEPAPEFETEVETIMKATLDRFKAAKKK